MLGRIQSVLWLNLWVASKYKGWHHRLLAISSNSSRSNRNRKERKVDTLWLSSMEKDRTRGCKRTRLVTKPNIIYQNFIRLTGTKSAAEFDLVVCVYGGGTYGWKQKTKKYQLISTQPGALNLNVPLLCFQWALKATKE